MKTEAIKTFRQANEANDDACRRAFWRGQTDAHEGDGYDKNYAERREIQECYAEGYSLARCDAALDRDTEWG